MEKNRTISVIIPAFNAASVIEECLEGLSRQTFKPFEIIVVDDGSLDGTGRIASRYATVIIHDMKKGPGGARNTGAKAAVAGIVAFIDSDCVPPPSWLENIDKAFSDESIAAAGGGYSSGADNSFWQVFCCEELAFRRRGRRDDVKTLVSNNFACRRQLFLDLNGFPEQYPVCEDMLLSYKVSQRGRVVWLVDNGVRHHFKDSLAGYLKHQYYFGAESTRFFLENPEMLRVDNHQGKTLHWAIIAAFLFMAGLLLSSTFFLSGRARAGQIWRSVSLASLIAHFILYVPFLKHLICVKFPGVAKAYGVSFIIDAVCVFSSIDGALRVLMSGLYRRNRL